MVCRKWLSHFRSCTSFKSRSIPNKAQSGKIRGEQYQGRNSDAVDREKNQTIYRQRIAFIGRSWLQSPKKEKGNAGKTFPFRFNS